MAKMSFKMPDDIISKMSKLGDKYDEITMKVLEEGAKPLFEEAKTNLASSIGKNTKHETRSTGDLLKSLRTTKPFLDNDGNWAIKVGTEGIDNKGVSNPLKGGVLEFGKDNQVPRPWLKPSSKKAKQECIEKMKETLEAEVKKL